MSATMRADQLLVARQLAATRSQAQRLIAAGARWRVAGGAWQPVRKSGEALPQQAQIELQDDAERRYVSRGGLKLQGALAATGLNVAGWRCLDVGQSTGGFTDCLLQHGAAHVTGVDVGHGQLHPRLAQDARVRCIERVNARHLDTTVFRALCPSGNCADGDLDPPESAPLFDLVTGDLSFISLTLVLPALAALVRPGGHALMLAKPQFELQPQHIGKGGIVRDGRLYALVEQRLRQACAACGLGVQRWLPSPIAGGDGNREFFLHATRHAPSGL